MNNLELVNGNKGLEKLLTNGDFIKTTESTSVGSSNWLYETYYSDSLKCRIEYNTTAEEKGYSVFLNVSEDIEDTIDCDLSLWFTNLKSLQNNLTEIIVEFYDKLHSAQRECEDKWGEDIDDDCTYMDFRESTEELDEFYEKHSSILDKINF